MALLHRPDFAACCLALGSILAIAPHGSGMPAAHAQEVPGRSLLAQANAATVLLVNPATGNDATADGSEQAPFKTITQALQVARSGTVILLTPGIYSPESGETFPIALKPGITLQGNPQTRGQGIVIQGSGFFLSPTFARQKVAVLGANQATLAGVTITNPEPQGYGLWIESSSPAVVDSTFTGNTHDGISVNGRSNPLIRGSYFYDNGANGITIYGTSRPEVRGNIFEKTGFAINVNQKAAPLLVGNRITQNKDGIVVQATARPVLRNNSVEANERDGLVAIAQSRPDLGTKADPGGNFFRNNGQMDVNVKSSDQVVPAVGNEMSKTAGQLDLAAIAQPDTPEQIAVNPAPAAVVPAVKATIPKAPEIAVPAAIPFGQQLSVQDTSGTSGQTPSPSTPPSEVSASSFPSPGSARPVVRSAPAPVPAPAFPVPAALSGAGETAQRPRPLQLVAIAPPAPQTAPTPVAPAPVAPAPTAPAITSPRSLPALPASRPAPAAIQIPVPQPESSNAVGSVSPAPPILARSTPAAPIDILVPAPEHQSAPLRPVQPPAPALPLQPGAADAPNLLPVPGPNVPLGNIGDMPTVSIDRTVRRGNGSSPPVPPSRTAALGFRYRVVVDSSDASEQAKVRSLVPGAFRSSYQGRTVMQVGAFAEPEKADELIQALAAQGMTAVLEQLLN
jgi:parallel beta-helix repeat protein